MSLLRGTELLPLGHLDPKAALFSPQLILGELHFIAKNSILHQQVETHMASLELQEKLSPANGMCSQG